MSRRPAAAATATTFPIALALAFTALAAPPAHAATQRTWDFEVRLDGKPIGGHRFVVVEDGDRRAVTSEAAFDVRLMGFSVYRYAFRATENWTGDCLQSLVARTDDDGRPANVRAEREGDRLRIRGGGKGPVDAEGCVMTYAYWHPALRAQSQTRLLNPQTGQLEPVTVTPQGTGTVDVGTARVTAQRVVLAAPPGPVEVWTTPQGEWIGLDARVKGGRILSYRLKAMPKVEPAPASTARSTGAADTRLQAAATVLPAPTGVPQESTSR